MKTNLLDIVSKALLGKEIKVTDKYGDAVTAKVQLVNIEPYGWGDVGIFVHDFEGKHLRIDFTDEIEILTDEKQA